MQIITIKTPLLKSNMYLLVEHGRGIIIDPYWDEKVERLLQQNIKDLDFVFLTHEHYDHISGVNDLKKRYDCNVWASAKCAERVGDTKNNFSRYFNAFAILQEGENSQNIPRVEPYICKVDCIFEGQIVLKWRSHTITLKETPGHSPGSVSIYIDMELLFTGDSLVEFGMPITRFPDGNQKVFDEMTLPWLRKFPGDIKVFPGHYQSFYLGSHDIIKNGGNENDKFRKV